MVKKTGQARVGLAHQGFRKKIGGLELFLKFKSSLATALSCDSSLELAVLKSYFTPLLRVLFLRVNH